MLEQFSWERLGEGRVRDLARRIRIEEDSSCDAEFPQRYAAQVVVRTRDGRVLRHRVATPNSDASRPLKQEEIENKFFELVKGVIPTGRARAIRDSVNELDCRDVSELVALLAVD